jgi:hypothetical protein
MTGNAKVTIALEGQSDLAIVKALLPSAFINACKFLVTDGRSTLVSVARTFLIKHHLPIAIMLDTDTMDPASIAEIVRTTRHLMGSVAGQTPFDTIYCTPHVEMIFFDKDIDLRKYFPEFENVFILPFALTQPKAQLQVLFERGGGPADLNGLLAQLTKEDIRKLRSKYPIQHLMAFISNNTDAAVLAS